MKQFHAFSDPNRVKGTEDQEWLRSFRANPDARVITVAYYSLVKMEDYLPEAASFASETIWVDIYDIPKLAFDHNNILNKALSVLREQSKDKPIGFHLLPTKFTLCQLQHLNEVISGEKLDLKKHNYKIEIKSPTFHLMEIKENDEITMQYLLDL